MNNPRMRARKGMLIVLCSLPFISFGAHSSETSSSKTSSSKTSSSESNSSLTLKQALQLTLQQNPQLTAYPFYIRQLEAQYSQADISPALMAEVELAKNTATLTLSQSIELGDKRQARTSFTSAKQAQLQAEFEITKLDVLAETSRRYYQLLALQKQKVLLSTRIGQEQRALKIIKKRAKAGAVAQADVATMELGLARSNNTFEQLNFEIALQKNSLSAMWLSQDSLNQTRDNSILGSLSKLPLLPNKEALTQIIKQGIEQLPDYRYQIALARLADQQVALNQANGRANVNLGLGLRHNDSSDEQSLVVSASMPLNFSNPNRGRIASAQAGQALSQQQLAGKRLQLSIELNRISATLEKELQQAKKINNLLLPLASELLSSTQKAYRQGQYTVLQWVDAQNQVFNLEQDLINSQVRIFTQILELERILGQSIVSAQ